MTLLVVSDNHIGAGSNLGRSLTGPGSRLADQRGSWERVCVTACELEADVLHAGDGLHHRKPSPAEQEAFQAGLDILREGGRTLVGIAGNHEISTADAPSSLEVACAGYDAHILRAPDVIETIDGPVGFLPWAPYGDAREMAGSLMILAEAMRERGARVLIAHWALSGASLPTGLPILELAEPILDSFALAGMGFELVLSGHIHKRQTIVDTSGSLVAHIGPLSRGNFGEAGLETGGWQVGSFGNGVVVGGPFDVPDRAFVAIEDDVRGGFDPTDELITTIASTGVEGAICRVSWLQTSDQVVDTVALVAALTAAGAHKIDTLTPIIERAQSTRSAGVTELTDPRESFDRWLEGQRELAAAETLETARERAHERIGGAA